MSLDALLLVSDLSIAPWLFPGIDHQPDWPPFASMLVASTPRDQTPEEDQLSSSFSPNFCPAYPPLPCASTVSQLWNLEVLISSCPHSKSLLSAFWLYPLPPPALNTFFVCMQGANVRFAEGRLPLAAPQLKAVSSFVQHDSFWSGWPSCGPCSSPALPSSYPLWAFLPLWAFTGPGLPCTLFLPQNVIGLSQPAFPSLVPCSRQRSC